jgi:hypothetical protein
MDVDFTEPAFLVKYGVHWDIAHSLDPIHRRALCIFYGELEGVSEWNFSQSRWQLRKTD